MISERKKERFLTSKLMNFMVVFVIMIGFVLVTNCYADALDTAKSLLSKACLAGGGLWAVWGLVMLGMSIKDHNGPGIQGAIWQIIGGGIVIAAGVAISSMSLDFSA